MTCAPIASNNQFVASSLAWFDCTGRSVGENGYQVLAAPGSMALSLLLALLTLFIAAQGMRLMFGRSFDMGDAALAAAKIGLALMLATSWPATRTLAFDTVIQGPGEIAGRILGSPDDPAARLQSTDDGLVALTAWGSGKLDVTAGRTAQDQAADPAFAGQPVQGGFAMGLGRTLYLVSVLATLGLVLLAGGCLVALLPLVTGFLLFDRTRGIFIGWVKGLLFLILAGAVTRIILMVETAYLGAWLPRIIAERQSGFATPSAPIELLAITATFAMIIAAVFYLLAKAIFSLDLTLVARAAKEVVTEKGATIFRESRDTALASPRYELPPSRGSRLATHLDIMTRRDPRLLMDNTARGSEKSTSGPNDGWSRTTESGPRTTSRAPYRPSIGKTDRDNR
ncbi:MAG TPA: type IV secretion system protein [Xanthobacteraceae bacterium]|jgi:type IV secretion system protein VirB6|nr:type IV secretion system protein [Xanthobacteraceae bacterium]